MGVAIAIAFCPTGVDPLGVNAPGVMPPGVCAPGVMLGVAFPDGVIEGVMADGVATCGVRSQRERRLLALGVGVSWIKS